MNINATIKGFDDWSRCLIKTERGTTLCDINCLDEDVLRADPSKGHWHTITDWGEPLSEIKPEIQINLLPKQ